MTKKRQEEIRRIKEFYTKALYYLLNNDYDNANTLLYTLMPVDLYDKAISIALDKNNSSSLKELKKIIIKVDELMAEAFILGAESSEDNIIEEEDDIISAYSYKFKEFD